MGLRVKISLQAHMSSLTTKEKCNTVDRINEAYMASHYEDKALVNISKTKSDEKVEEMSPELIFVCLF